MKSGLAPYLKSEILRLGRIHNLLLTRDDRKWTIKNLFNPEILSCTVQESLINFDEALEATAQLFVEIVLKSYEERSISLVED